MSDYLFRLLEQYDSILYSLTRQIRWLYGQDAIVADALIQEHRNVAMTIENIKEILDES